MKKFIKVRIVKMGKDAGHTTIETEGFKGTGCAKIAGSIAKMLSTAAPIAQKHKADYYKKDDPEQVVVDRF